jgi:quercetin dioxygenase-like cupin family protein
MALAGTLHHPKRYITSHDPETGKSVIDTTIPTDAPFYEADGKVAAFAQCYVTEGFPVQLSDDVDLRVYKTYLDKPPGIVVNNGTVLRYVDIAPGKSSPMHRTLSLDFGVLMEGEIELVLDSGETKKMEKGDLCVQRGTMHAWRNTSDKDWARMLFILQPSSPIKIGGEKLKEDYGGMVGVRASS